MLAMLFSSVLNVIFLAQDTPSASATSRDETQGPSMRVQNLSLNGWIALMVLATIAQQLPFALLFLTLINILQSRWYAFTAATTGYKTTPSTRPKADGTELYQLPAFLGWRGKQRTSFFIAIMLVFLPILSRIILAVGVGTFPNSMVAASGDFERFETLNKVVAGLDGLRAGMAFIAVFDIAVSSFCLEKRLRVAGYCDSVSTRPLGTA